MRRQSVRPSVRMAWLLALAFPAAARPAPPPNGIDSLYRLDAGDKLRVIVFGEDNLGGEFVIGSNGHVALPLVGEIAAAGLTPSGFQGKVTTQLRAYLKQPRVSVEVLNYRPFYILGEVNKPGEYAYAKGATVLSAVAQAQGFTYRASTHKVLVRHAFETSGHEVRLEDNLPVEPGDVIRIKERWF